MTIINNRRIDMTETEVLEERGTVETVVESKDLIVFNDDFKRGDKAARVRKVSEMSLKSKLPPLAEFKRVTSIPNSVFERDKPQLLNILQNSISPCREQF